MKKLLLTGVFGPFGVDDEYGRKENVMELFHNQVTREQGLFSLRMNHQSFGLHMIAVNIIFPTVVLDFPTLDRFIEEIKKGYEYVGISFIVPNFIKAQKMAQLIRQYSPKTKIILGGHGTMIENVEKLIPNDFVCRGEGVYFMRKLLGESLDAPLKHPMLYSAFGKHIMGVPTKPDTGVIFPGVGCVNGCKFCCTTHFFEKRYTPYLRTGKEVFDVLAQMEQELKVDDYFIMDENFLKDEKRARELLFEMEKNGKAYSFGIFSSAEAVSKLGVKFLERLGVRLLWLGVESKKLIYEKNQGIDFNKLVKELREHGISVLASAILFLEHHTKKTIEEDIGFTIGLNADLVQFMQLGPLPGTKLYKDYDSQDKLLKNIAYEEWHGQKQIWFKHPCFTQIETEHYLKYAFEQDFQQNGPSLLRMLCTSIMGVENLSKFLTESKTTDEFLLTRLKQREEWALGLFPLLDTLIAKSHQSAFALRIRFMYEQYFGKKLYKQILKSLAVRVLFKKEEIRSRRVANNMRQPKTLITPYRCKL